MLPWRQTNNQPESENRASQQIDNGLLDCWLSQFTSSLYKVDIVTIYNWTYLHFAPVCISSIWGSGARPVHWWEAENWAAPNRLHNSAHCLTILQRNQQILQSCWALSGTLLDICWKCSTCLGARSCGWDSIWSYFILNGNISNIEKPFKDSHYVLNVCVFRPCVHICGIFLLLHLSPLYDVLDHTNHTFSESLSSGDDNARDEDLQKGKYEDPMYVIF